MKNEKKEIPYYHYKGVKGVLYDNEFIPENKIKEMGLTADDYDLTYDDSYSNYGGDTDIIQDYVVNIENEQHIDYEWISKAYRNNDYIERMYLDVTDRFHNWESEISNCLNRIEDVLKNDDNYDNKYVLELVDSVIQDYIDDAMNDINKYHPELFSLYDVIDFLAKNIDEGYTDMINPLLDRQRRRIKH